MTTALLLITLGFGFKIFAEATASQKKQVKRLGRLVGIIMMAVSVLIVACSLYSGVTGTYCPFGGSGFKRGGYHGQKYFCPMWGKAKGAGTLSQQTASDS